MPAGMQLKMLEVHILYNILKIRFLFNFYYYLFAANHEGDERLVAADPDTGQLERSAPGDQITADTDTYVWRDACRYLRARQPGV
jgi:hypothetical protein